jgi:hypothetical protein
MPTIRRQKAQRKSPKCKRNRNHCLQLRQGMHLQYVIIIIHVFAFHAMNPTLAFLQSLDSSTGITSPEIEAEASMQPKHAIHIPSSATLGPPPTRMSVMEDNGRASPLLSGSTSDSLSDRTPGLSEVEDASGEEEADEQVPPIPGPSRTSGRSRSRLRPSVSVPQAVRHRLLLRYSSTHQCIFCTRVVIFVRSICKESRTLPLILFLQLHASRVNS